MRSSRSLANNRATSTTLIGLSAIGALVLTGCGGNADASNPDGGNSNEAEVIKMATLPAGDDPTAVNPVDVIRELVEAETGMKVEVIDAPDYLGVVEAVRADHVDIALMSAFPSALAVNTGEVDALMTWPGSPEPVSKCYVLQDSPLQSIEDLAGKTVAFADPGSSSGFFMPVHLLDSHGLTRDEDYEVMFTGGHDRSALAVKEGQVDASCTASMLMEMGGTDYFPFEEGETRVIGESVTMDVSMAVIASQEVSETKRAALLEALPKVFVDENAEELDVYRDLVGVTPTLEPSPEVFQSLVDVAAVAGVDIADLQ